MFLSKFFKFTRGKALIAFAGLAMVLGVTGAISTVAATQQNEVVETKADTSTTIRVYVDFNWDNIEYVRVGGNSEGNNATLSSSDARYTTSNGKYVKDISSGSTYDKMGFFFKQGNDKWEYQYDGGYVWIDDSKFQPGYAFRLYNVNWVADGDPKKFSCSVQRLGTISDAEVTLTAKGKFTRGSTPVREGEDIYWPASSSTSWIVAKGQAVTLPTWDSYTYSGINYTSTGWYSSSAYSSSVSNPYTPSANTTLYVLFADQNKYHVTLKYVNSVGESIKSDGGADVTCGNNYTLAAAPTVTNYTFVAWHEESYTGTIVSGSREITGAVTFYAVFNGNAHTFTRYCYNTDGTLLKTVADSVNYGNTYTFPNDSIAGYKLYSWYTAYNATTHAFSGEEKTAGSTVTVGGDATYYGRYIASNNVYLCLQSKQYNATSADLFDDNSPSAGLYKKTVSISANELFYVFHCNSAGSDYDAKHANYYLNHGDCDGNFESGDDGNIKCKTGGTYDIIYNVSTHAIYIYYNAYTSITGYYMVGTGAFAQAGSRIAWSLSAGIKMTTDPSLVGDNTAILESASGLAVSANDEFRVYNYTGLGSITLYSMVRGADYDFCTVNGDNIKFRRAGHFNFYFKAGGSVVYIVDVEDIDKYGILYVASNSSSSDLKITTKVGSTTVLDNVSIGSISGFETAPLDVSFNGKSHLYRMPIFNLRGTSGDKNIDKLICDGNTITIPTAKQASIIHYFGTSGLSSTDGALARAVFDITVEMNKTSHKSICEITQGTAQTLCSEYDAGDSSSYVSTTAIFTWDGSKTVIHGKPVYEGDPISNSVSSIRVELGNIAGGDYVIATASVISAPSNDQSPLTLTLWIVLGAGILGMGAIGTAYFVSKKKKRHQA